LFILLEYFIFQFLLPGILHTLKQVRQSNMNGGPSVLILLPTRELAQQVENVAMEYCQLMGLRVVCVFGGAIAEKQAGLLRRGGSFILLVL